MNNLTESILVLVFIVLVARFIKRKSHFLQKYFIPSSLLAGFLGLLFGPQLFGIIPAELTEYWAKLPKYLITVVFAGLFLGRAIPKIKTIWHLAGPQIAFGNILAWGQYALGLLLTIFILTPVFDANPMVAALIEISFEGGHGTAAGLAPTFSKLGFSEGSDIALALATFSIFCAIISGIFILNWHRKKEGIVLTKEDRSKQEKEMIRSGYNLINFSKKMSTTPQSIVVNAVAFGLAIALGWLILKGLILIEATTLSQFTEIRFFPYVPLFPLAMIGGLLLQLGLRKIYLEEYINRRNAEVFSALALDFLIASAIATLSLQTIGDNLAVFTILGIAGIVWILGGFFFFAPRIFPDFWFEKGLTNIGQSMGTTATGLMLLRQADPSNKSKAKESFAYKQLVFEPFMGGGIITATSVIIIHEFGSITLLVISVAMLAFWYWLGRSIYKKSPRS